MSTTPTICFNNLPAISNSYFNHNEIYNDLGLFEPGKDSINTGQTSDITTVYISHNHNDEISNVGFYLIPFTGSTSAVVIGTNTETFNIIENVNDRFIIKIDERTFNYDIKLNFGSDRNSQNICDEINFVVGELVAFNDNGKIKLISPSKGIGSKIYIISTNNTANTVLGFIGNDLVPSSIGTTNNWGKKGNGSHGKVIGNQITFPFTITNLNNEFKISLNYSSEINCVLSETIINNDIEFKNLIDLSLTNAGFSILTDLYSEVENGILKLISYSTEDNTSVRIFPGINNALNIIGMENPILINTDYANSSASKDLEELLIWGDSNYGLEIGDPISNFTRFKNGIGDLQSNSIPLTWGDGSTTSSISKFDYSGGDTLGEIPLKIKLSVPPDENETGFREWSLAVQFTYI